ncbi:hypothetical protein [Flavobacterium pallidum]|uniref:DUF5017 domain-containing protein n=1 Tax=Flavobacterium pallidum TaxID=2172098 RepID=A0A2S1SDR1_9FLAO|nr:hypothetical protein [Flavobacterium pallidum]AWI24521.1 hypothetical protein HYN49_00665 [Flavobacterium pallidum]
MKNIKLIFALLAMILLVPSCENDGGDSVIKTQNGTVPDIQKIQASDQVINFVSINNGGDVNLQFTVDIGLGEENFQSMDVVLFYIKGDGTINKFVLDQDVTSFPKTYTLTLADILADFADVNAVSDITIQDQLIVSTEITLKDGTLIKMTNDDGSANYAPNIASSSLYSVIQTYDVSCPIDDASNFSGNYKAVSDAWADYAAGDDIPLEYHPEDGQYTFRILSTNNPYLINYDTSYILVTIDPATGKVTAVSNEDFNYGPGSEYAVTGTGDVKSCTGAVTLDLLFSGNGPYKLVIEKE